MRLHTIKQHRKILKAVFLGLLSSSVFSLKVLAQSHDDSAETMDTVDTNDATLDSYQGCTLGRTVTGDDYPNRKPISVVDQALLERKKKADASIVVWEQQ